MQMIVNSIELINFKGVENKVFNFDGNADIVAENGVGKSTLVDAWLWLWTNKDYELNSNPDIRPNDNRECIPTVQATVSIDGKTVILAKMQKKSVKKDGSVALSNSYEVNGIPLNEKAFKEKLSVEYDVDFDRFLALSHPDAFIAGIDNKVERENMRKLLFSMVSDSESDFEIASSLEDTEEITELLKNYTLAEVEAMANNNMKKIASVYGKNGELIDAEIKGRQASKVDIDVAEVELQIKALEEELNTLNNNNEASDKLSEMQSKVMSLKFEQADLSRKANAENIELRTRLQMKVDEKTVDIERCKGVIKHNEILITDNENKLAELQQMKLKLLDEWKEAKEEQFDETLGICPTCGNILPSEKVDTLKSEFANSKAKRLKDIENKGNETNETISECKTDIENMKTENEKLANELKAYEVILTEEKARLEIVPANVDVTATEEYKAYTEQITSLEAEIDKLKASVGDNTKKNELTMQLAGAKSKLELARNNINIDEEIQKLEQKKIDCKSNMLKEKAILEQVLTVNKAKNERLADRINANFNIVKWRLFTYQKNGEYKEDCTPMIDGKLFGNHTNGALKTLAKVDIVEGLQKFFGNSYPVFIDNFEHVTENTRIRINPNFQLITLTARDGIKELTIV